MREIVRNILVAVGGGLVAWFFSTRWEVLRAWKVYEIVRLEADRNIKVLDRLHKSVHPVYAGDDDQQRHIDELTDTSDKILPVRVLNLVREDSPSWVWHAWNAQLHLLSQILLEDEVKAVFELQVCLDSSVSLQMRIKALAERYGPAAREIVVPLFEQWDRIVSETLTRGNPSRQCHAGQSSLECSGSVMPYEAVRTVKGESHLTAACSRRHGVGTPNPVESLLGSPRG